MELKMSKITHFFSVYRFPDKNYTRTTRILNFLPPWGLEALQVELEGDQNIQLMIQIQETHQQDSLS